MLDFTIFVHVIEDLIKRSHAMVFGDEGEVAVILAPSAGIVEFEKI